MEAAVDRAPVAGPRVSSKSYHQATRFSAEGGLLFLVVLLGLALRAAWLDFQPLWWDEGYSAWFATHPLGQMAALTAEDIHPPLYYALLHLWTLLGGTGPVSLRLASVLFGVAAIPAIYAATRRILPNRRAALFAAFLLAINPLHVFYSQEIRMYGLVALLSTGVLWAAWGVFSQRHNRTAPIAYVILTTLALYTQYYAIFLPIALTLYAVIWWRKDLRSLARWLGLQAVVALLYLPWAIYAGSRLVLYVSHKVVADADRPLGLFMYFARHLSAFIAGHLEGPLGPWWPLALLVLIPLAAGLVLRGRSPGSQRPAGFLAVILGGALFLGWLIGLRYPFFPERGERLLLLALPAFLILAAAGLDALLARPRPLALATVGLIGAVSAASLAVFYVTPRYAEDDYRPLIARTVEQGLGDDTVYCVYPWQVGYWRSYAQVDGPVAVLGPSPKWGPEVQAALQDALAQGRVWFPAHLSLGAILEKQIERFLGERAVPFANTWYGPGTRLSAWSTEGAGSDPVVLNGEAGTPLASYSLPGGGQLGLQSITGNDRPIPAANRIADISLAWQASFTPPELGVSVRLADDLGQIWAQNDHEPLGALAGAGAIESGESTWRAADRLGLLIPAGTPPGRYRVKLLILPKGSTRPLDGVAQRRAIEDGFPLFDLEVTAADQVLGPERLPIATRETVDLGDGLRFLGYTTANEPLTPGALRRVNLFWQAEETPASDYTTFVQLLGRDGSPVAGWEAPPGAAHPTTGWAPGTLIRTQASFRAPATLADGHYRLIAGLYRPSDGTRLATPSGADHLELGTVTVRGRDHQMTAPKPAFPAGVTFGNTAHLLGVDLDGGPVDRGGALALTLHWRALGATDRPYTVFVHLLDEQGQVRGNGDGEPGNGTLPTTGWLGGEYLADEHVITAAGDAPAGSYRIAVGLYDPGTGQRLTTQTGEDRFILDQVVQIQ